MSQESHASSLLLHWQELRERGLSPSPEELCHDCPELLPNLRQKIEQLVRMEALAGALGPSVKPEAPPQATSNSHEPSRATAMGPPTLPVNGQTISSPSVPLLIG